MARTTREPLSLYICHCRVVTERAVRAAIAAGAETVEEIGVRCGAGTTCRACHPELERLLSERAGTLSAVGPEGRQA